MIDLLLLIDEKRGMQTTISKVDSSAVITFPTEVLENLGFKVGDRLEIIISNDELILRAATIPKYTQAELLQGMSSDYEHTDEDLEWLESRSVGREIID